MNSPLKIVGNFLSMVATFTAESANKTTNSAKTGLPRTISALKVTVKAFKLFSTGLSTRLTSWWNKHPLAFPRTGKSNNLLSIIRLSWLVINCIYTACINTVLGARVESQRKRSHFAILFGQCFEATQPTCLSFTRTGKSL